MLNPLHDKTGVNEGKHWGGEGKTLVTTAYPESWNEKVMDKTKTHKRNTHRIERRWVAPPLNREASDAWYYDRGTVPLFGRTISA